MKAPSLLSLALFTSSVLSLPSDEAIKRSIVTVQNSLVGIQQNALVLDSAVRGLAVNPQSVHAVTLAAANLEAAMRQATLLVQPLPVLAVADAVQLQTTADILASSVKVTVMDVLLQQQLLGQVGLTATVVRTLQVQQTLAVTLGQVIVTKLPPQTIVVAQQSFAGVAGVLNMGVVGLQGGANVVVVGGGQQNVVSPEACAAIGFVHAQQVVTPEACAAVGFLPAQQQQVVVSPEACAAIGFVPAQTPPPPEVAAAVIPPEAAASAVAIGEQVAAAANQTAPSVEALEEERKRRARGIRVGGQ